MVSGASAEATASPGVSYDSLSTNDIIVVVDGKALTKADLEERVALATTIAKAQGRLLGNSQLPAIRLRLLRSEAGRYVSETLLLNAAKKSGVETTSNAVEAVKQLMASADGEALSFETFAGRFSGQNRKALDARVDEGALIYSYVMSIAGQSTQVAEADIDDVVEYAKNKKALSESVLEKQRQKAADIFKKLQGGEEFEDLAADSYTADEDFGTGEWGDFAMPSLEQLSPGIAKAVSTLNLGEFTRPIEMEDAIYIVKLAGVTRSSDGVASHDIMSLKRIVVPLPMLYEVGSREEIRGQLLRERVDKYQTETLLPELLKSARIEYPNGQISYGAKNNLRKENKQ